MAQIGKFLDPPKPNIGNSSKREPDPAQTNSVMLPVTGFLRRLGALIFDLIFLYFFARIIVWAFGDILLPLAKYAEILAHILFLLYFALGASPAGRGKTIGKIMLGIRVTNLDGESVSFGQAFIRTFMLYPIIVASLVNLITFDPGNSSLNEVLLRETIPYLIFIPLLFSNFFAIAFNPYRQGCHDYLCKTMVRPISAPQLNFEEIKNLIGTGWKKYQLNPQLMAGGTFIIIFGLLVYNFMSIQLKDGEIAEYKARVEILNELEYKNVRWFKNLVPVEELDENQQIDYQFYANLFDETSTNTIVLRAELFKNGTWLESRETFENDAEFVANRYHKEVISNFDDEFVLPRLPEAVANFKKRPVIIEVAYSELLKFIFIPFIFEERAKYRFSYEPMDPRPLVIDGEVSDNEENQQSEEVN